jgi:hypothetical protein
VRELAAAGAAAVVGLHFVFVAFVVGGAALLWRWPRLAWLHLPAATWGAWVECSGAICPLTPLENHLRALAGEGTYAGGFVEHTLLPVLYPTDLTRHMQLALGAAVVAVNVAVYGGWLMRLRASRRS